MRRLMGGLVLVAGVGGLGWYAAGQNAKTIEAAIAAAAADVAGMAQHGAQASVSGRDIIVTGLSDDGVETANLAAAFDAIPGRRDVDMSGLSELEIVTPFLTEFISEDGVTFGSGAVPTTALRDVLEQRVGADNADFTLANGEPDTGWDEAATTSLAALQTLKTGVVTISDQAVTVKGLAATPSDAAVYEAAMADLPDGYTLTSDIMVEDDGAPLRLDLAYDGTILTGSGKLPSELSVDDLAIADVDVDVVQAVIPAADANWPTAATAGITALSSLRSGTLLIDGTQIALSGVGSPDEIAAAQAALDDAPAPYTATFASEIYDDGAPLSLSLTSDGASIVGQAKLPAGMAVTDIAVAGKGARVDAAISFLPSEDGQWRSVAQSGLTALGALSEGTLNILDRDITLAGTATPDVITAVGALFETLPDGYTATTNLTVFDDGAPFSLMVVKDGVAVGKVPSDFADIIPSDVLSLESQENVTTAFITDDTGTWPAIAESGLSALGQLQDGALSIVGDKVTLIGTARSVDDLALIAATLEGQDASLDLNVLEEAVADVVVEEVAVEDVAAPIQLDLSYTATGGAVVEGNLPSGLSLDDIASALNISTITGTPELSDTQSDANLIGPLTTLADVLPEVDALRYIADADDAQLDLTTAPGVDAELVAATLTETLAGVSEISVKAQDVLPDQGDVRLNRFTNRRERFTSGNWLPILTFASNLGACQDQTDKALAENSVTFLSGSARLEAQSVRAINLIAAITRKCALEAGVSLNVDGHTDSTGNADNNLTLSQARADAVRDALLARGIGQAVITATGFGITEPIADNTTEEGRAANRRTEFNWVE